MHAAQCGAQLTAGSGLLISVLLMRKVRLNELAGAHRLNRLAGLALPVIVLAILAPMLVLT